MAKTTEPASKEFLAAQPKLFLQCLMVYNAMERAAVETEINGESTKVWTGKITNLVTSLGIGLGIYGKMMKQFNHLGCITILTQGRVGVPTEVALHFSPASVEWTTPTRDLTDRPDAAILEQQIRDIHESLGGLNVKNALMTLESRIKQLEKEIETLTKGRTVAKKPQQSKARSTRNTSS